MAASYPTSTKSFTTKVDGDVVYAADTNSIQEEIVAIETDLRAGLSIARGGTGATTAADAINALVPTQGSSAGKYLKTDGSVVSWDTAGSALPTQSAATTGQVLHSNGTTESWADTAYDNNYIIDGNFQICQVNPVAGTEITNPTDNTYSLFDLWKYNISSDGGTLPTIKVSQQSLTSGAIPNSKYFYNINVNGAGTSLGAGSYQQHSHFIEHGTQNLCGLNKKVTFSFWARTSISGTKRLAFYLYQTYGTGGSPSAGEIINGSTITLTSTWTKFTYTFTTNTLVGKTFGTNNDDYLRPSFMTMWGSNYVAQAGTSTAETFVGSGDIQIAQVKLEPGDTATAFIPRQKQVELMKCQQYLVRLPAGTTAGILNIRMSDYDSSRIWFSIPLPAFMRITPSLIVGTEVTDWQIYTPADSAQTGFTLTLDGVSTNGYIQVRATKTGHGMTDAILQFKSNFKNYLDARF